jgi:DNA gyrase/topoisomerase IV subunit B
MTFQIAVSYDANWFPPEYILSFANEKQTIYGGSLVQGIKDGIFLAFKKYVEENQLTDYTLQRNNFLGGLIIVCFVRGDELMYEGGTKEKLYTPHVRSQVKTG